MASTFPTDTTEFRLGGFLVPQLRRWYERTRGRQSARRIFWPGFFLSFDIHLHLATYSVSNLPWWPASLIREQPVAQLAIRCPFFCLVLAYRACDWNWMMRWRTEVVLAYSHSPGWRFVEGEQMFRKEMRKLVSEWFLSERAVRLENGGYRNEIKFERVY